MKEYEIAFKFSSKTN